MSTPTKITLAAIVILTVLATFVIGTRSVERPAERFRSATVLPQPLPIPDFRLANQDGEPFTRDSLLHRESLLFFGFTHCPDICPATLQQLAVARRKLAADRPDGSRLPSILLISVDPERDTPAVLREYTSHFGSGVGGIGGDLEELRKLTSALGIYFAKEPSSGQEYTMNHSSAVLLINKKAELQAIFSAPLDIDSLVADLRVLTKAP